ncbi:MAG: FKBP-type peptidyl-prolyl cis-trans isomerase [Nitrospiraceae bacterium]
MRSGVRSAITAITVVAGACLVWVLNCSVAAAEPTVADGMTVTLEYTLTLPDKTVADSNVGQAPFSYQQGAGQIVPGLERALVGAKAGDTKHVEVPAVDAYGPYDMKKRLTVEKAKLPDGVKNGDVLQAPDGSFVTVVQVNDKDVVIDTNHPLAGKNLTFDVKVVRVEKTDPNHAHK